jgi:transposase
VRPSIEVDLARLERYDCADPRARRAPGARGEGPGAAGTPLRSIPGVGKVLGLTILSEIHDVRRFERV